MALKKEREINKKNYLFNNISLTPQRKLEPFSSWMGLWKLLTKIEKPLNRVAVLKVNTRTALVTDFNGLQGLSKGHTNVRGHCDV